MPNRLIRRASVIGAVVVVGVTCSALAVRTAAQTPSIAQLIAQAELPPLTYICPMHPEVVRDQKGNCPICNMELAATRIALIYTCPTHQAVQKQEPGKCPLDGRDLVPMTMDLVFTCADNAEIRELNPGKCPDGKPLEATLLPRAHGDHNPKHGGMFYMMSDNWHHVEGTYPETGVFRMYFFNEFSKPLEVKDFKVRAVTKEQWDAEKKQTIELAAYPMVPSKDGMYLEAKIEPLATPAQITAKVKLTADGREQPFNFTFQNFSKEPDAGGPAAAPAQQTTSAPAAPAAPAPAPAAASGSQQPALNMFGNPLGTVVEIKVDIPERTEDIVTEIAIRSLKIQQLVRNGKFDEVFIPALEGKDLAVALNERVTALSADKQAAVMPVIKRLVRAAWLLDSFGDLGNREQITSAYDDFAAAVADIKTLYGVS